MNKTKLCVIGDPIEHSLSPVIHNTILELSGLPFVYGRVQVNAGDAEAFLCKAEQEGYGGFNATMPHKTDLVPLMDELDTDAQLYQAVNTVVLRDGKRYGCNTDGLGFLKMLEDAGVSVEGKTIAVLGAGGAAGAVVLKMAQAGAARIFVCSRTLQKAERLAELFPGQITPCAFEKQTISDCALFSDLLVNATPLGMTGVEEGFSSFGFLRSLPKQAPVCDLIYDPAETELLRAAGELGHPAINGLGMLIHQAMFALEHFTGMEIDREAMLPKVEAALKKAMKNNI